MNHITQREKEVLNLVAHEHSTKEIADTLFISTHTVLTHRKNLLLKMNVKNTAGLVRRAFEVGLLALKNGTSVAFVFFFLCFSQMSYGQCNGNDFKALRALYVSTNGANWNSTLANDTSWDLVANNATPPAGCDLSTLTGVMLDGNGRVTSLNLSNNNLTGTLTNLINGLEALRNLNLSKNKISGNIPINLGEIQTLEVLQLQENNLGGTTGFTGSIPIAGSNFPSLRVLRLNKNTLTGGIPAGIGLITSLEEIGIHNNNLGGSLPASIAYLPNLTNLKLFNNGIAGCIPPSYKALCSQLTNANVDNGNSLDASWVDYCNNGDGACDWSFVTTWQTDIPFTTCSSCITIPTEGSGYSYDVDWDNDGVYDELNITGDVTYDFVVPGIYTIAIKGDFPRIHFNNIDADKLLSVDNWGDIEWASMHEAFARCSNLVLTASDIPDLTNVTSLFGMFFGCSSFNSDISNWDVSSVTDMSLMFVNAESFNQPLDWGNMTSIVTSMASMFSGAKVFNQDISNWDVSSVTDMSDMFEDAYDFNQPLDWGSETSNVTNIASMFSGAKVFNQDISNWDVSSVTDMSDMFSYAVSFNQPLDWGSNTSNVLDMRSMFEEATSFNKDISTWDVTNVVDMEAMFKNATSFNASVAWQDVSKVEYFSEMFEGAISFNKDISMWTPVAAHDMNKMFAEASSFNKDISSWSFPLTSDIGEMFYNASLFNQNLASWDISNVDDMDEIISGTAMSVYNYDQTLISWASQTLIQEVNFDGHGLLFCEAESTRQLLIDNLDWDFDGDAKDTGLNTYTGDVTGYWISSHGWSLGRVPSMCSDVIIQVDVFLAGNSLSALGATLEVEAGAELYITTGSTLEIGSN